MTAVAPGGPTGQALDEPSPTGEDVLEFPVEQTFALNSLPGSDRTIYLDFDGHVAVDTSWGDEVSSAPFDLDGDPSTFSEAEHIAIQRVWMGVAEDFAPFDVNVTTEEPDPGLIDRDGDADQQYGTRVAIGDRTPAFEGSTVGLAYPGAFDQPVDHDRYQPAWVDLPLDASPTGIAFVASHEVGHTLGLCHQFDPAPRDGWTPMMWAGTPEGSLTQWATGPSACTFQPQDPFTTMASHGVEARLDDHPDERSTGATSLGSRESLSGEGIISTRDDVDVFELDVLSGAVDIAVTPAAVDPNLDIRAELLDADGNVVTVSDPDSTILPDGLAARITTPVEAGTYYLTVDGVGFDGEDGGWTDEGSLGRYTITGTNTAPPQNLSLTSTSELVVEGGSVTVSGTYAASGGGAPSATAVWSDGQETAVTVDDGAGTFATSRTFDDDQPSGTADDDLTVDITLATSVGSATATSPTVTVANSAPVIGGIRTSASELDTGEILVVAGSFTDRALGVASETFTADAVWSDGTMLPVAVDGDSGTFETTRTFGTDDVPAGTESASFTVTVMITDDDGGSDLVTSEPVVVLNTDLDGDGVKDEVDLCPDTELPDMPLRELKSNRYRATIDGFVAGDGTLGPTLDETGGCSATQIVELLDLGDGHLRFGITASALDDWVDALG